MDPPKWASGFGFPRSYAPQTNKTCKEGGSILSVSLFLILHAEKHRLTFCTNCHSPEKGHTPHARANKNHNAQIPQSSMKHPPKRNRPNSLWHSFHSKNTVTKTWLENRGFKTTGFVWLWLTLLFPIASSGPRRGDMPHMPHGRPPPAGSCGWSPPPSSRVPPARGRWPPESKLARGRATREARETRPAETRDGETPQWWFVCFWVPDLWFPVQGGPQHRQSPPSAP